MSRSAVVIRARALVRRSKTTLSLAALVLIMCGSAHSPEQVALDRFVGEYWRPDIFDGECSGLKFASAPRLVIASERSSYKITPADVAYLVGLDLQAIAREPDGWTKLVRSGTTSSVTLDLSLPRGAESTSDPNPPIQWDEADGFLLRFSERLWFQDRMFLQLWVKGGSSSSGTRLTFVFGTDGMLQEVDRVQPRCDDWG